MRKPKSRLAAQASDADRASRIELLAFQLQELEALTAGAGEYEELQAERQVLANSGRLAEGTATALTAMTDRDGGNAVALLAEAARSLGRGVDQVRAIRGGAKEHPSLTARLRQVGVEHAEHAPRDAAVPFRTTTAPPIGLVELVDEDEHR